MNLFLTKLYNGSPFPTNPSSLVGNVLAQSPFLPAVYTTAEQLGQQLLFGTYLAPGLPRFLCCLDLLWLVQGSTVGYAITSQDPLVQYRDDQLVGQFRNTSSQYNAQWVSTVLQRVDQFDPSLLGSAAVPPYSGWLSSVDRLAAIITHFGTKGD